MFRWLGLSSSGFETHSDSSFLERSVCTRNEGFVYADTVARYTTGIGPNSPSENGEASEAPSTGCLGSLESKCGRAPSGGRCVRWCDRVLAVFPAAHERGVEFSAH